MNINKSSGLVAVLLVVAVLAGAQFAGLNILPLAIATCDLTVSVKSVDGAPVGGALVDLEGKYSIITGSDGSGFRGVAQGVYSITVTAAGYKAQTGSYDLRNPREYGSRFLVFALEKDSAPIPAGFTVSVYLVAPTGGRVKSGSVTLGGVERTVTRDGLAVFSGVSAGVKSIRAVGLYENGPGDYRDFDFTVSAAISGSGDQTIYVATRAVLHESPPSPPLDPYRIITDNWILILLAAVAYLVLRDAALIAATLRR